MTSKINKLVDNYFAKFNNQRLICFDRVDLSKVTALSNRSIGIKWREVSLFKVFTCLFSVILLTTNLIINYKLYWNIINNSLVVTNELLYYLYNFCIETLCSFMMVWFLYINPNLINLESINLNIEWQQVEFSFQIFF